MLVQAVSYNWDEDITSVIHLYINNEVWHIIFDKQNALHSNFWWLFNKSVRIAAQALG